MRFIDVNQLPAGSTISSDICIVGAGAAGIAVAAELDGGSQTVSVIESGSHGPDEDTQALYDLEVAGHPVREKFMSRARYYGGSCNLWAGKTMRLTPMDVARRDWVPHSGWPLPYDELERYYERAARMLRLPSREAVEAAVGRDRMSPVERTLFDNADLRPAVATWAKKPLRFGAAYRKQLQRSPNVRVYLNANVTDIGLNEGGTRVEHCRARSLAGRGLRVRAGRFVVACGGLETARLLLASRSVHPTGIGNQFDAVGRYYMDHPRAVFGTVRFSEPQKLPLLTGLSLAQGMAQVGIQISEAAQKRERLLNNYLTLERYWSDQAAQAYQSLVRSMKIVLRKGYAGRRLSLARGDLARIPELIYLLAPRELLPHSVYSSARTLKHYLSSGLRELVIVNYCEQRPDPQSRVYLGETRDRLDMPVLVLDWKIRPEETESLLRLQSLLDCQLRRHGLGRLERTDEFSDRFYRDASHHIGTARMSGDPRHGVVDDQCAVHGVGNLFIAGSAVFPTSGHANPTLTLVALAIRLADHLKRAEA